MIVRLNLMKKHVDLSKIVAVSDAYFIDRMGHGGYYVGFHIDVQLLDHPLKYERKLRSSELNWENFQSEPAYHTNGRTVAEMNLQEEINEIIELWKEYL